VRNRISQRTTSSTRAKRTPPRSTPRTQLVVNGRMHRAHGNTRQTPLPRETVTQHITRKQIEVFAFAATATGSARHIDSRTFTRLKRRQSSTRSRTRAHTKARIDTQKIHFRDVLRSLHSQTPTKTRAIEQQLRSPRWLAFPTSNAAQAAQKSECSDPLRVLGHSRCRTNAKIRHVHNQRQDWFDSVFSRKKKPENSSYVCCDTERAPTRDQKISDTRRVDAKTNVTV
jgi:hypothetical protein